jgi:hypothetical protein
MKLTARITWIALAALAAGVTTGAYAATQPRTAPQGEAIIHLVNQPVQGCVWKGRAYRPGHTLLYTRDGPILSKDLKVNGQDFGRLSGKPGPWQQCDCLTSRRHWGCV